MPIDHRSDSPEPGTFCAEVRNAALCAATVAAALLIAWPFVDLSFNDDWTFAFTVKRLNETGRLTYNGWSSPSIIAQACWGLLWVKLFGFSFNILRLSTLPLAAGAVGLCYALARRAGLGVRFAVFAALLLGLSPLFLPLAASFMTDVPGLFFFLLALYALVRVAEAPSQRAELAWLGAGMLAGAIGGSSRQIVWVVPLVLLPYIAWQRRRDRRASAAAVALWFLTFASAWMMQRWFDRQPYALPEPSVAAELSYALRTPLPFAMRFLTILPTAVLLILPAGVVALFMAGAHRLRIGILILCAIGLLLLWRPWYAMAPWMVNIITPSGVLGSGLISGQRATILTTPVRAALSLGVFVVMAVLSASALQRTCRPGRSADQIRSYFTAPADGRVTAAAMMLLVPAYLALLLTRCALDFAYDRHLLLLIPCLTIPLLLAYQKRGHLRPPGLAWALLGVFGVYAIASTQDVFALARARVEAARRVEAAGVPRTRISAGFEYDAWTELLARGYVNEPRIVNPPGAWISAAGLTPSVRPLYRVEHHPARDTTPSEFGRVAYTSFLPPFHREVWIDRFSDPWWLDPVRASTRPLDGRRGRY